MLCSVKKKKKDEKENSPFHPISLSFHISIHICPHGPHTPGPPRGRVPAPPPRGAPAHVRPQAPLPHTAPGLIEKAQLSLASSCQKASPWRGARRGQPCGKRPSPQSPSGASFSFLSRTGAHRPRRGCPSATAPCPCPCPCPCPPLGSVSRGRFLTWACLCCR